MCPNILILYYLHTHASWTTSFSPLVGCVLRYMDPYLSGNASITFRRFIHTMDLPLGETRQCGISRLAYSVAAATSLMPVWAALFSKRTVHRFSILSELDATLGESKALGPSPRILDRGLARHHCAVNSSGYGAFLVPAVLGSTYRVCLYQHPIQVVPDKTRSTQPLRTFENQGFIRPRRWLVGVLREDNKSWSQ